MFIHYKEVLADCIRMWKYRPGQYCFLQVPKLGFFQWHPFTISVCLDRQVQLHIKTDGNWTKGLRGLVPEGQKEGPIQIGLNGPFGAPAERFYDYSHTILVSSISQMNTSTNRSHVNFHRRDEKY